MHLSYFLPSIKGREGGEWIRTKKLKRWMENMTWAVIGSGSMWASNKEWTIGL